MVSSSKKIKPVDEIYTNIIYDRLKNKHGHTLDSIEYAVTRLQVKQLLNIIKDRYLLELLLLVSVDQYKSAFKPTTALHIGTLYTIKNKIPVPKEAYKYSLLAYKEPPASTTQKAIDYWIGYWIDTKDKEKAIQELEYIYKEKANATE